MLSGLKMRVAGATVLSQEALLFSQNFNSQHLKRLTGPWVSGTYKLILVITFPRLCLGSNLYDRYLVILDLITISLMVPNMG